MDTLEHIETDKDFLNNLLFRMDIGANLLISVPAFSWLFSAWDRTLGHYRRYEKKDLSKLVNDVGGSILFMEYTFFICFLLWWSNGLLEKLNSRPWKIR